MSWCSRPVSISRTSSSEGGGTGRFAAPSKSLRKNLVPELLFIIIIACTAACVRKWIGNVASGLGLSANSTHRHRHRHWQQQQQPQHQRRHQQQQHEHTTPTMPINKYPGVSILNIKTEKILSLSLSLSHGSFVCDSCDSYDSYLRQRTCRRMQLLQGPFLQGFQQQQRVHSLQCC